MELNHLLGLFFLLPALKLFHGHGEWKRIGTMFTIYLIREVYSVIYYYSVELIYPTFFLSLGKLEVEN